MSDAVSIARNARESLSRGLSALQGDPNVPQQMLDLAAPIAQAMGALHQIERSGGAQLSPSAQTALACLQGALGQLQSQPKQHPAVGVALEAVAGALAGVHALARAASAAVVPSPTPAQASVPTVVAAASPAPIARAAPARAQPQTVASPGGATRQPVVAPVGTAGAASASGAITAELGALSPSNFYKGLSGNDIIDHGGLFVSTYKLPKIGHPVRLRVALPGGYEFEANAVVRWHREPSDDPTNDAPPGFGAQFTEITAEARQLVYRYVRNREPLFHDDL